MIPEGRGAKVRLIHRHVVVAQQLTPTGRKAKGLSKPATPLFALAKTATLRKRIKGQGLLDEIMKNFPSDFVHALMGELAVDQREGG